MLNWWKLKSPTKFSGASKIKRLIIHILECFLNLFMLNFVPGARCTGIGQVVLVLSPESWLSNPILRVEVPKRCCDG